MKLLGQRGLPVVREGERFVFGEVGWVRVRRLEFDGEGAGRGFGAGAVTERTGAGKALDEARCGRGRHGTQR
ncbi:hypothetical protein AQI96_14990 [Streptomyces canus]|nr:hypothetical protein AQI96_14990 [Streptomyces canus]